MKIEHKKNVKVRFNLYSDDGLQGATCIVTEDGHFEVIPTSSGTMGKADDFDAAIERCKEVAADHFRHSVIRMRVRRLKDAVDALGEVLDNA